MYNVRLFKQEDNRELLAKGTFETVTATELNELLKHAGVIRRTTYVDSDGTYLDFAGEDDILYYFVIELACDPVKKILRSLEGK